MKEKTKHLEKISEVETKSQSKKRKRVSTGPEGLLSDQ